MNSDAGALREIARKHHQVGRRLHHRVQQGRRERRVDTAKMQVRKMNDGAHLLPLLTPSGGRRHDDAQRPGPDAVPQRRPHQINLTVGRDLDTGSVHAHVGFVGLERREIAS